MHDQGVDWFLDKLKNELKECKCIISGGEKKFPIQKIFRDGDIIKIFVNLDEDVTGTITEERLMLKTGHIFAQRFLSEYKSNEHGLLIVFEYEFKEVQN